MALALTVVALLMTALVLTVLSGFYPAFLLSRVPPTEAMRSTTVCNPNPPVIDGRRVIAAASNTSAITMGPVATLLADRGWELVG